MTDHGVTCSMSRSGNCWDNAAMESFFSSLKTERTARKVYRTRDEAKADVERAGECCAVAALLDIANRLTLAFRRAEEAAFTSRLNDSAAGHRAHKAELNLIDQFDAITAHAAFLRAQSAKGIIFQLAIVRDRISNLDEVKENEKAFEARMRGIMQTLYLIYHAVEEVFGRSDVADLRDGRALEWLMPRALDPNTTIDSLLAKGKDA